eukprot:CAMPEP_0194081458 /NCGR_PEP_ID=MMETSP0149-20130528/7228_1 /TAXON_ID=122233 /ORGANISM="Chaetoceros debilis, Strain MM31A-1" /LENGTH=637 /DNA_ID=CAMNT_0038763377 /DNA_START=115 /DNA_END=2028 /DNA_ORIENTATION=+
MGNTTVKLNQHEDQVRNSAPSSHSTKSETEKKKVRGLKHQQTAETTNTFFGRGDDNVSDNPPSDHDNVTEVVDADVSSPRKSLCGNIINDIKQTIGTHWVKEMTNFNQKTIAVSFFLFFAAVAPAITFGAIYAKVTHNYIGAIEMLAATAWCGIFYALVGGMPIMINGGTGPVLAFSGVLYKLSQSMDVPFLTFNAWVGLWVCAYMLIGAVTDLNRIIQYATRFTDEIFALLISAIFIIDALGSPFQPVGLYYYFQEDHKSHDENENEQDYSYIATALLSLVLGLGTTMVAFMLRKVKFSPFCCSASVRSSVTDFSVTAAILFFTVLDKVIFKNVDTETLNVPDKFAPSFNCCTSACDAFFPDDCPNVEVAWGRRPWIVDLFDLNGKTWVPFMAALPALLAFVLVFLDDGITWHLINHPSHKLKHGVSYNYDTIIVGFMIGVNSVLGLPWLVAATVRSLNHLHALGNKTSDNKFIDVQETRLSNLFVHVMVLASIFALNVIKLIPVPVLYGVFLFMGLVSLSTNQMWGRFMMYFMQPSKYPDHPYTKHVSPRKMHCYTLIQMGLFGLLYAVKSYKTISIAFPLVIAACIPIRLYVLPRIFSQDELILLDAEDKEIDAWMRDAADAGIEAQVDTSRSE